MNIEKITTVVPISGTTGARGVEHHVVTDLSKLVESGVNFDTYQIREGETLQFPKFADLTVEWRAVSKGNKNGFYLVLCHSIYNGKERDTWFSLPQLKKVDKDGNPVNPTWFDLGNDLARLQKLCEMGEITGGAAVDIEVYDLDGEGKRVQQQLFNADGTPQIVDGKEVWIDKVKTQHHSVITPCE